MSARLDRNPCSPCPESPFSITRIRNDLDLEVALRHQLLQPSVFLFQLTQALHVGRVELAELPAPHIDRLLADAVLLGDLRNRGLVGLAENLDHLLFGESTFTHSLPHSPREHPL